MNLLEVEALDLGPDVKAVGLELIDAGTREPLPASDSARIWGPALAALAGSEPWALDFFSHLDCVREFCDRHGITYREAAARSLVVTPPEPEQLEALFQRFVAETFGARAGGVLPAADAALEGELARRGVDAYHPTFPNYFFCAVCDFEGGFLTVLSNRLWASEVVRRLSPALRDLDVRVTQPV